MQGYPVQQPIYQQQMGQQPYQQNIQYVQPMQQNQIMMQQPGSYQTRQVYVQQGYQQPVYVVAPVQPVQQVQHVEEKKKN